MSRQRFILIGIFVLTFIIGIGTIFVSAIITSPKKTITQTTATVIPNLASYTLACSSTGSNQSLTVIWKAPANIATGYFVAGQVIDTNSQTQPASFGPIAISQGSYTYTGANGLDTYQATLWIQDKQGKKGTLVTTNQINSSLCTSGTETTPAPTTSVSTTPSGTPTPTVTVTTTTSPSPTPTTNPAAIQAETTPSTLVCNSFTVTQNGTTVTNNTIIPSNGVVSLLSNATGNGTVSYANAIWSITPTTQTITPTADKTGATWTPSSAAGDYVISISGIADSSGLGTTPCTLTLTVANQTLPNTGDTLPTQVLLTLSVLISLLGVGLLILE